MSRNLFCLLVVLCVDLTAHAEIVDFGSGDNQFAMEFVTIGDPGNPADTTGVPSPAGAVGYTYVMGKFEVSREMVSKANAEGELQITLHNLDFVSTAPRPGMPTTGVSWNEAARFVNWLNVSQGYSPAYKFLLQPGDVGYQANRAILLWEPTDPGYNPSNLFRNTLARFFLPSADEWYKAAYFDADVNGGEGGYWDYPTGSDDVPTPVASGTAPGTAVYTSAGVVSVETGPADVNQAGGLSPSGVMGLGGNTWEWTESEFDGNNDTPRADRVVRGGGWCDNPLDMSSVRPFPGGLPPEHGSDGCVEGFRVAGMAMSVAGDTNGDGVVDLVDLNNVRNNFGGAGFGDTNDDGTVDLQDLNAVRNNFGASADAQAVPEPSALNLSFVLLCSVASVATFRRRAKRSLPLSRRNP